MDRDTLDEREGREVLEALVSHRLATGPGCFGVPASLGGRAPTAPNPLRRFFFRSASDHAPAAKRSAVWRMYRGCYVLYNFHQEAGALLLRPHQGEAPRPFRVRVRLMYGVGVSARRRT
jgi:hypothetical protein